MSDGGGGRGVFRLGNLLKNFCVETKQSERPYDFRDEAKDRLKGKNVPFLPKERVRGSGGRSNTTGESRTTSHGLQVSGGPLGFRRIRYGWRQECRCPYLVRKESVWRYGRRGNVLTDELSF